LIHWSDGAAAIHNLVRTLAPLPGAETNLNNERLKIIETQMTNGHFASEHPAAPGAVLQIVKKQGVMVACGDRPLIITKLQPAGKKVMSALDYANGRHLKCGMLFYKA